MPREAPLLEVEDLRIRYGQMLAVASASLKVEAGSLVALIGANGAGKTTILKAISGLLPVERGVIRFDGKSLVGRSAHAIARAGIGHVPEGRGVLGTISVAENFRIGGYGRRDRAGLGQDRDMVLQLFPSLRARWTQPASVLSGGEQQMLSIARALLKSPKLLIIDEMSLGLAPKLVLQLMEIVLRLVAGGKTVLCVEQNTGMILKFADYVYVVQNGRVVHEGIGRDLLADGRLRQAYLGGAGQRQ